TGHCSTQAPQVVHDHSTSGSMTEPMIEIGSMEAPSPPRCFAVAAAFRYGACSYRWSRRSVTSFLGDRGLPVFQAGHCDWQRPHSVQVVKSSRPFQLTSVMVSTPNGWVSGSAVSKSAGLPSMSMGLTAPREGAPSALRLK